MQNYYDIVLKDESRNVSISYWADSFSVDRYRILRVKSEECGDVTVAIGDNERMFVSEVFVEDEFDEFLSAQGLEAGDIFPPAHPESWCSIRRENARQIKPEPSG